MMRTLRRPAAWLLACAAVAGMTLALSGRDWAWVGDPLWGQETIGIAQVLVLPIAAGTMAVTGWRDRSSFFTFVPSGRPQVRHVMWTLASWILPLAMGYLVVNVAVVAVSHFASTSVEDATPLPVLTQLLGMFVAVAVGYALGFALDSWAGALVAAVTLALTLTFDRLGTVTSGLAEYAANGIMLGAQANLAYFGRRMVWLFVLGAAMVLTVLVRSRLRQVVAGFVLLTLLAGTVLFRTNTSYAYAKTEAAYCVGAAVQVCGPPSLAPQVRQAAAVAAPVAAALNDLGVVPPRRLTSWEPAAKDVDWVMLFNGNRFRDPLDPGQVISALASPTSCRLWSALEPPPAQWFAADRLVRSYLARAVGRQGGSDYQQLSGREGAAKATRLVREAAQALQACELSLVPAELKE